MREILTMSQYNLPNNFSTQIILNNIASVLINNTVSGYDEKNYVSLVESMLQMHDSVSKMIGSDTKINKLEGIDWKTNKVTDIDLLIETCDDQVDAVQAKASNDMKKLIIQQQKYIRGQTPERVRQMNDNIINEFKSIGYKTIDRSIKVKSDNQKSLESVAEILRTNRELDAFVDSRLNGRYLEVMFPEHLTDEVYENLVGFNGLCDEEDEHIVLEKITVAPSAIPGMKDIHDVERKRALRKELEASGEFSV